MCKMWWQGKSDCLYENPAIVKTILAHINNKTTAAQAIPGDIAARGPPDTLPEQGRFSTEESPDDLLKNHKIRVESHLVA